MKTFGYDGPNDRNRSTSDVGKLKRACLSCGTDELRANARFCMACGRELEDLSYRPAAALRATYHLQQQRRTGIHQDNAKKGMRLPNFIKSPTPNRNSASSTSMAFVTYALVPYLGILFCPGAVLMGGIGLIRHWRLPHVGGRGASYAGVFCGIVIFGAQVFLWWILYKVPQWATGLEF
jgi:hypothetical protein